MKAINPLNNINEKENKLFNRKEIQINIKAEVTPSHKEAKELISKKFSIQPENIRIKKISGKFGTKIFTISANIYPSEAEKNKIEIFSKKEAEKEKKSEPEKIQEVAEQPIKKEIKESPIEEKQESPAETILKKEQEVSNEIAREEAVDEKIDDQVEEAKEKIKEETKIK